MAGPRRFEIDDILIRPGTYFNPETEVMIVVDDSPHLDTDVAEAGDEAGGEWLLVSDETPVDEHSRDELLEAFSARFHPGTSGAIAGDEDDPGEEDPELEPDVEELE
ncbi:MAG: hypothetical protein M3P50_11320 [Actinomycetota bacterium]|nr:hypothetical protein [Actinomycetota bacterium]